MSYRPSVLFVCLGNICRSPLAEAAFRHAAQQAGLDVEIDSAGTGDWHVSNPPDPRARDMARRHGVVIDSYRARQLVSDDFRRFAHVFVMDHGNLRDALAIVPPDARCEPRLLLDLVPGREGTAVADPYYGDETDFAQTWSEVTAAADALVRQLLDSAAG